MVSLQYGFGVTASQTFVAVSIAQCFELLGSKTARTGVPRSPPLAKIVGLGLPDFLGVILCPLLTASDYFITVELVVLAFRSAYAFVVLCCPSLPVLGYLFLVYYLILSAASIRWGRFALAFSSWVYCSKCSRRYFCARALTQTLHFPQRPSRLVAET